MGGIATPAVDKDWKISYYIKIKPSTVYIFTNLPDSFVTTVGFYTKDKTFISGINNSQILVDGGIITTPSNCEYIRVSFRAETENTLQLEEGNVATAYIKGAVDTPSPDYPSEVRSVGDIPKDVNGVEIRNLLDEDLVKQYVPTTYNYEKVSGIEFEPGTYKIKIEKIGNSKIIDLLFVKDDISSGVYANLLYKGTVRGEQTLTIPEGSFGYFVVRADSTNTLPLKDFYSGLRTMITSASEIDEYRPYIGENNGLIRLESSGINRADAGDGPISMAGENNIEVNTWTPRKIVLTQKNKTASWAYVKLNVERGKTYTFYCKAKVEVIEGTQTDDATSIGFRQYPPGGVTHGKKNLLQDGQYKDIYNTTGVIPDDVPNMAFMIYLSAQAISNGNIKITIDDLMVVEGEKTLQEMKAIGFQPYRQQITWIPLKEPLRKIDDYADSVDKWGNVTQAIDSFTFPRGVIWSDQIEGAWSTPKLKVPYDIQPVGMLSEISKIVATGASYLNDYYSRGTLGKTLQEMNHFSENNEFTVYYVLKIQIEYQIQAIYIETYDPETNVKCLNKVKPYEMTLDYKVAMSSLIKRLEALETTAVQEVTRNV